MVYCLIYIPILPMIQDLIIYNNILWSSYFVDLKNTSLIAPALKGCFVYDIFSTHF